MRVESIRSETWRPWWNRYGRDVFFEYDNYNDGWVFNLLTGGPSLEELPSLKFE